MTSLRQKVKTENMLILSVGVLYPMGDAPIFKKQFPPFTCNSQSANRAAELKLCEAVTCLQQHCIVKV